MKIERYFSADQTKRRGVRNADATRVPEVFGISGGGCDVASRPDACAARRRYDQTCHSEIRRRVTDRWISEWHVPINAARSATTNKRNIRISIAAIRFATEPIQVFDWPWTYKFQSVALVHPHSIRRIACNISYL